MKKILSIFISLLVFAYLPVSADEIHLKNGRIIKGKILKATEENIEYHPEGMEQAAILNKNEIEKIKYDNGRVVDISMYGKEKRELFFIDRIQLTGHNAYYGCGAMFGKGGVMFYSNESISEKEEESSLSQTYLVSLHLAAGSQYRPYLHIGYDFLYSIYDSIGTIYLTKHSVVCKYFPSERGFYIKGGAGMCNFNYDSYNDEFGVNEISISFTAGAGYHFNLGDPYFFGYNAEFTYYAVSTEYISNLATFNFYITLYFF